MARQHSNARRNLDAKLVRFRPLVDEPRPHRGWIRAIREALGMTTVELAARMGISQPRVPALEQGEVRGSLKLESLQRAADALDCDLVYALVPRTSLDDAVLRQARRRAEHLLAPVGHHMLLEDQAVSERDADAELDDLAAQLVDKRGLWTAPRPSR